MSGPLPSRPGFRAGFIALLGRPNAGKSTLLNRFLRQKLSIVSPQPQTTRHRILGILNREDCQACFIDTPGLLDKANDRLQDCLIKTARLAGRQDADLAVLLVDPRPPSPEAVAAMQNLARGSAPLVVAVNKCDEAAPAAAKAAAEAWTAALAPVETHAISALRGDGCDSLLAALVARLPESPPFYPTDQASDRWERFFASEVIRERLFELFHDEIPHACAVVIEAFKERDGRPDQVSATVFVERPQQKAIVIGSKGTAVRRLQAESQKALAAFLGRPCALEILVKVRPNWRTDPQALKEFGYAG